MRFLSKVLLILSLAVISSLVSAQTLTISAPWELKAENPTVGGYAFTRMGVTQTLIAIDKSAQLTPQLATKWSVNKDKTQWTLTLRDGVTFTDGEAFNADIAVKALNTARTRPGPLKKAPVKSIVAKNNSVVITLEKPYAVLPAVLAHYTTMMLSPKSYDKNGKVTQVIGTGPFKIARFEPPQRMDVIKNDNYWGKKASINKAEYVAVSRGETRALMAESKPAIMAYSLDPASIKRLARNPKLNVMSIMLPRVITIKVNNAHPFMKDVNVRQAMSHAIDRNGIAGALMRAPEIKTTQLFPPSLTQWHNSTLKPFAYEPSNAKQLLKDAGFAFNKDGYASKDGKLFEVTLRTYADRPELPLIANALQDQFKKVGIKMNVSIGSYTEIPAGHKDGTLDLALMSRNYATVQSPLNNIRSDFGRGGADWGAMNWENETVAKALDALTLDNADKNADKNRAIVTKAIQEELPVIPVTWYKQSVVVSKALKGVSLDPFDSTYRLEDISVAK